MASIRDEITVDNLQTQEVFSWYLIHFSCTHMHVLAMCITTMQKGETCSRKTMKTFFFLLRRALLLLRKVRYMYIYLCHGCNILTNQIAL